MSPPTATIRMRNWRSSSAAPPRMRPVTALDWTTRASTTLRASWLMSITKEMPTGRRSWETPSRSTASRGTTARPTTSRTLQNDLDVIASYENGFGYRADDHGNSFGTATALWGTLAGLPEQALSVAGIVEQMTDADYFRFQTTGGQITVTLNVAEIAPNLDARLELWRPVTILTTRAGTTTIAKPQRLAWDDLADQLGAAITMALPAGTYYLVVRSHGQYGDLGQYTLGGDLNLAPRRVEVPLSQFIGQRTFSTTSIPSALGASSDAMVFDSPAMDVLAALPVKQSGAGAPSPGSMSSPRKIDGLMSQLGSAAGKSRCLLPLDQAIDTLAALQVRVGAAIRS